MAKPIGNAFIRQNISNANPAGQSNALAIGFALKFFLDHKRPVTEGFTHVTARWIAQPPKAAFVTRLRSRQLPGETARQLPDLSTTICVDPSSTGETRHRGALNYAG